MTLPDIDTLDTYGGALSDYAPVEDPTTDESAAYRNKYVANVAMMSIMATRAMRSFVGHATTPADPSSGSVHAAVWGQSPSVKPTVAWVSTGVYDITWPATVSDLLAVSHTVNFRRAFAQVQQSDGTFRDARAKVTGANTVRVYAYLSTTLDNLVGETITAWVW